MNDPLNELVEQLQNLDEGKLWKPILVSIVYRLRKLENPNWLPFVEGNLPKENEPFWALYKDGAVHCNSFGYTINEMKRSATNKWLPCTGLYRIPKPPLPEKEKWEVAVDKQYGESTLTNREKSLFKAGYEAAKKE